MVYIVYTYSLIERKGENELKILLSEKSIAVIALVMLLSLSAVASITILANAAPEKDPNVFVTGEGSVRLTWKSGKSQTYSSDAYANFGGLDTVTIIPNYGWIYIAAVEIDGISQIIEDEDGFTLINIQAKENISATFEENSGVDDVDTGLDVMAYPYSDVRLIFGNVSEAGEASAYAIEWAQYPLQIWNIQTTAYFLGDVEVILVLSLTEVLDAGLVPENLKLWRTEVWLARADVNYDGVVDGTDVSIVANANPSEDPNWLRLDQNYDGVIDDEDVNIVNNYIGETVWEELFTEVFVDEPNDLVYVHGETDHFSIFGAH